MSTPLVYENIYHRIQKILDKTGVQTRAGRDTQFKQFIRFIAHFFIYMLLKYRLPKKCAKTHDLVIFNYIELLIETANSPDDFLTQIVPGYFRFTINKLESFAMRVKFLILFKDAPPSQKRLYTTLASEDLDEDQAKYLIEELLLKLERPQSLQIDWKFDIRNYLDLIEFELTNFNFEECNVLLHGNDYRQEFNIKSDIYERAILKKYELSFDVMTQVQEWSTSKDSQVLKQLQRQFKQGRPPRETKFSNQTHRISQLIKAFILPNFDSTESASESTLVFDDKLLQIVEPRELLRVYVSKLGNLLVDILRFEGKYNQLDSIFLKIYTMTNDEKCANCFYKWLHMYKQTIIEELDHEVIQYLQKYKGLSLPFLVTENLQ